MKRAILISIVVWFTGCAHAPWASREFGQPGPAIVTGQVADERGAVLVEAHVTLSGPAARRTATTDITGRFAFDRVPLGRYVVSVAAAGFKGARQSINVDKETTVRADFKLRM